MSKKRVFCLLLSLLVLLCALPFPAAAADETAPDDVYCNWYEVFVYSFADSDGDGIGDLNGLREKLPYIQQLGCGGIWLMPIMPSPSYHKYDVTDYYAVDPQYGTLEDLRALLEAAHGMGIRVILDLPINHSSEQHPWFLSAAADESSPYRDYYNWSDSAKTGYTEKDGLWYESRFVSSMPDLNLENPAVREEIRNILSYWLCDVGVDGFRLDAVTSYYTGDVGANVAFLDWLADTAHTLSPGCFLVAEAWENLATLSRYSASRIDSFFTFPVSQNEGYIAKVLMPRVKEPGVRFGNSVLELEQSLDAASIPAPFLENHDTGRTVGFTGRQDPDRTKMAGGLLCMMRGALFLYYGQEIGMVGSGDDPNKRIGMLWTTEAETTTPPPGVTKLEYAYPSVAEQDGDPLSLLNYYRHALALRGRYPAIARGASRILPCEDGSLCLIERSWNGQSVLLAINLSRSEARLDLSGDAALYSELADSLTVSEAPVTLQDGSLLLPGYGIALLLS